VVGFAALLLAAPAATGQTTSAPIQASEQGSAIHGIVVNAKTGQPVGRVLVQAEGSSLLTGYDGRFGFSGLSGTVTTLRVRKPGFYLGMDPYQSGTKQVPLGSADEVRVMLYPEALITGTVSTANGEPLGQVQVQALRRTVDELGARWTPGGQTMTNGDGQFRLPLAAGEYVVETQYMANRQGGRSAILPVMAPAVGSNGGAGRGNGVSTLRLASGTEEHLELHPAMRPTHAVHIQIESAGAGGAGQFGPQIQAHLANGLVFSPGQARGAEKQGEVVVNLPDGSYLLSASTGLRDDAASYGETRVTVADEEMSGVTIHLQKALELAVEASVDPAVASAGATARATVIGAGPAIDPALHSAIDPGSASFVQQLGIFLQRVDAGVSLRTENVSAAARRRGPVAFTLLPGTYRLRTQGYSQWYVVSATAGGTDLLTQDLVVDGSSSAAPLRLVVSNQMATVRGTTKLGGQMAEGYVYLVAATPSTIPVIVARSAADGSFARGQVPPGSYKVAASEARLDLDLTDPAVQKQLAPYMKTVSVGAGESESVDLDAMPAAERTP
jgi:hypothetical protein